MEGECTALVKKLLRRLCWGIFSWYILIAILGIINKPTLFIIIFPIASLLPLLFSLTALIDVRKSRNLYTMTGCIVFFYVANWTINHYILRAKFHPISLLGNAAIILFSLFIGWSIMKPGNRRMAGFGISLFVLFIFVLFIMSSISVNSRQSTSTVFIRSLPYISAVSDEKDFDKNGVVTYEPEETSNGINIYHSLHVPGAYLLDMSGNILHKWMLRTASPLWDFVTMDKNGDLLVCVADAMLLKLNWDSQILWQKEIRSHHDISIAENNQIFALSRQDEIVFIQGFPVPILNDYINILTSDGHLIKKISSFKLLKEEIPFKDIISIYGHIFNPLNLGGRIKRKLDHHFLFDQNTLFDVFHVNTITIINKDIKNLCNKGNILISARELDLIGILDIEREKIVWRWGPGFIERQHHPTMTDEGNIIIFDNGTIRNYSRIIEINPIKEEIVWEYKARPPSSFFSALMGAAQRFSNGNTLVTESSKGYVFELTPDKKIVWEFYNPNRNNSAERLRIHRFLRITDLGNYPKLLKSQ